LSEVYSYVIMINIAIIILIMLSIVITNTLISMKYEEAEKAAKLSLSRFNNILVSGALEAPVVIDLSLDDILLRPVEIYIDGTARTIKASIRLEYFSHIVVSETTDFPESIYKVVNSEDEEYIGLLPRYFTLNFTKGTEGVTVKVTRRD